MEKKRSVSGILAILVLSSLFSFKSFSEDTVTAPYTPNRIDFNRSNAKALVSDLESFALAVARKHIRRFGSFSPFGVTITSKGEYRLIIGNGKNTQKDLNSIMKSYRRKAGRKEIVAAAIVFDTRMTSGNNGRESDAIYITCDSIYTPAKNAYAFYSRNGKRYRFGSLNRQAADRTKIFSKR